MKKRAWVGFILIIMALILSGCGESSIKSGTGDSSVTKDADSTAVAASTDWIEIETDPETGIEFEKNVLVFTAKEGITQEQVIEYLNKILHIERTGGRVVNTDLESNRYYVRWEWDSSDGVADYTLYQMRKDAEAVLNSEDNVFETITPNYISGFEKIKVPTLERYFFEWTDSKGYQFEGHLNISSRWILQSDTKGVQELLNNYFQQRTAPSIESWNFKQHNSEYYHPYDSNQAYNFHVPEMNDMYYLFGTVSIENVTKDWHFTKDNNGTPNISIEFIVSNTGEKNGDYTETPTKVTAITTRIIYGDNTVKDNDGFVWIRPLMTSDSWGSAFFVAAHAESFTPNNPDGRYFEYVKNMTVQIYADGQLVKSFKLNSL